MTGRQIPAQVWEKPASNVEAFLDGAGIPTPQGTQKILCSLCIAENITDIPEQIVFLNGSSLCINHCKIC